MLPQANMMPQLAAIMWPTLEAAAVKYGLRLGSPSAAGCGAWWVQQPAARVVTLWQGPRSHPDACCGAPAVAHMRDDVCRCTYGDPFDWWRDFFGNCSAMYTTGCRVDFMAMHLCVWAGVLPRT